MPSDPKKNDKKDAKPQLGPDGKPMAEVPLTEAQQIQLQIENTASEVLPSFLILFFFHFFFFKFSNFNLDFFSLWKVPGEWFNYSMK